MKTTLSKRLVTGAMVAAALSLSLPVHAQTKPAAAPGAKKAAAKPAGKAAGKSAGKSAKNSSSDGIDALRALFDDLQKVQAGNPPLTTMLERTAAYQPPANIAARLRAAFGTDRLFSMTRVPAADGATQYRVTILPVHFAKSPTSRVDWNEGSGDVMLDKENVLTVKGTWDKIVGTNGGTVGTVLGVGLDGKQWRSNDKLWFGAAAVRVNSVTIGQFGKTQFSMDGLGFAASSIDHGKTVDVTYDIGIAGAGMEGQRIEDLHIALRLAGIDRATMVEVQEATERLREQSSKQTADQQDAAFKGMMGTYAKLLLANGGLNIDDISARYRGSKVSIKGNMGLPGATEADLKDPKALLDKLTAQFDLRLPVALVHEVTNQLAAREVAAKAAQAAQKDEAAPAQDPAAIAQLSQTMTDVVVGRLVGNGYARLEDDTLVSSVEYRKGEFLANGKVVDPAKLRGAPDAP